MTASTEWNIQSRASTCQECAAPFADRQPCRTLLRFNPEGYQRIDLCEDCFAGYPADENVHSSWKGVYQAPPPPNQKTARKEDVETLLRRLLEEDDPAKQSMIFVLAVMLERKRILVERAVHTAPDGARRYVYEHRKSGDTFVVVDPDLKLDNTGDLEKQVANQLAQTGRPDQE